eukprot:3354413-Prymnesium_polylepis.1
MLGGGTRVKVRINGRADGGALVIVGPETTDEQFVAAAAMQSGHALCSPVSRARCSPVIDV